MMMRNEKPILQNENAPKMPYNKYSKHVTHPTHKTETNRCIMCRWYLCHVMHVNNGISINAKSVTRESHAVYNKQSKTCPQ